MLVGGGADTLSGSDGLDFFVFGDVFTSADRVDGGAGSDVLVLQGKYSAGVTFNASVKDITSVSLYANTNTQFELQDGTAAATSTRWTRTWCRARS